MRKDSVWHNRTGGYIETTNPTGYDVLINGSNRYLNFNLISGTTGYGIRDNAGTMQFKNSGGSWQNIGTGGAGATSFIGLTDVPASFAGASLKAVRVNVGESALEFYTPSGGTVGPGTLNEIAYFDSTNTIASLAVATYPNLTELSYIKGVTSAIQTQINGKQASNANLTSLAGLTYVSASFVKMTGANTFALDTNTYLTSLSGAVLTDQTVGQTIGLTGSRLTKLWATDITVTNAITGSVTGNAGTVTNATLATALTVNTGTVTLTGNVANTSVLTIGAGAVSVSGTNTGDQTTVSGNAGTATTLANTRTIWGQNFNGSANVTGTLALGTADLTLTGSIGATGARSTKGWFTDLESTNAPTAGGVAIPTISSTNTFTNKRITKRTSTEASSATPTINTDNVDFHSITALALAITSFTTNLSGTPTTGQLLWIAITDNGTARAITWGASFQASGTIALPTTTVISTRLDVGFIWTGSIWRCIATA